VLTREGTGWKGAEGFSDPCAGVAFDVAGKARDTNELTRTSSHLVAWYLCQFLGCHLVRKSYVPRNRVFGGVAYKTVWWLRY